MRSIFLKTLYEKRFFILGWTIGFTVLAALMTSFFPAMRVTGLDELVNNMPEALKGLMGDLGLLQSFDTYLASQLFDIRVPLIAGIMAIILGLGLSVAEEESGELRTMMALPVSRVWFLCQKWLAMVVIIALTATGFVLGTYLMLPFIDDASLSGEIMLRLVGMTVLIMVAFGTIPLAVGMATGKRAVATFVSVLVIIGGFLLSTFAAAVDWLEAYEPLSLLHYFPAVDIASGDFAWENIVVVTTIIASLLLGAMLFFRRRDIA